MSTPPADRNFWGPLGDLFDLSLTFEEVVMKLIPSGIAVLLLPIFVYRLYNYSILVRCSSLLWAKLGICAAIVACQAAALGFHNHAASDQTATALAAAVLDLVAALSLLAMLYIGHRYSIRSSGVLALYLSFTFGLDIILCRSYFIRAGLDALGGLAVATAVLRLLLLILEERSKVDFFLDKNLQKFAGSEAAVGFFTRSFYIYLNPMFMRGFANELRKADLVKLPPSFSSKLLHEKLHNQWENTKHSSSKNRLFWACFLAFKWDLMLIAVPQLVNIGVLYSQPFLIQRITEVAQLDSMQQGYSVSSGQRGGLQFATLLVYVTLALSKAVTANLTNVLATKMRGSVIAELMDKTHKLHEQDAKASAVLTHMSTDIDNIVKGLPGFIYIPMAILEVAVGVYLLSRYIGSSCFFVLLPVLGTNLFSIWLGMKTGPALAAWNARVQIRIAKTAEVLGQLPGIKMLGLGPIMRDQIQRLRVEEMEVSKPYRHYMALLYATQQFADICTAPIVVGGAFFWRGFDHQVSSTRVFPTLTVVDLIQRPTIQALSAYSNITSMLACFQRVQSFMLLPECHDSRATEAPSALSEPASSNQSSPQIQGESKSLDKVILFSNASIGPVELEEPLLTGIDFSLLRGSISGVLAPTGSGKSTLLKSLLGETKNKTGSVYTSQVNIAYCGADVWLRDASIRDNIVGCLEHDPVRYRQAIEACQLEDDIQRLPGGDDYVVGPNGFNLSGGQKQRLSLARSVFAQCEITIIDDGFSSLDRKTATSILSSLCGPEGLLRKRNSTVLICTYLPEVVDMIDHLITITEDGRVVVEDPRANRDHSLLIAASLDSEKQNAVQNFDEERRVLRNQLLAVKPAEGVSAEELYRRQRGSWRLYLVYIDSVGRGKAFLLAIISLLLAVSEFLPTIYLRIWTEVAPRSGIWYVGFIALSFLACALVFLVTFVLYMVFAMKGAVELHGQMLDVIMRSTIGYLTSTKTGNILNRFSQDCDLLGRVLPGMSFRAFYMVCSTVVMVGVILSSATFMTISLPAIALAVYFIQRFYLRTSRQMRHLDLEEKSPLYTFFVDTAAGMLYLRSFGWRLKNMATGYRLLDNSQQPYYLMLYIQQWLSFNLGLLTALVAFLMVTIALWTHSGVNGSSVGLSFLSIINFQRILMQLLEAWTGAETSVAAMVRLEQLKNDTPQEYLPGKPGQVPEDWVPQGDLDFSKVSSRYKLEKGASPVLQDLSLALKAGSKAGVVGRIGSGKSSLLLTLLGFLYYDGTVKIDGVAIQNMDPDFLRSRVISITQDSVQLNETVRKNLLPFTINDDAKKPANEKTSGQQQATDAMLVSILESLNLWTHLADKGGLDAMLQDTGYSKGELQLFSIARALVRRRETGSRLVLIDEATSNLDALRDETTQKVLQEAFEDCTVLTIAHREETIQRVDFKIALENGKMADGGASQRPSEQTPAA
ncbi:hypothetical protein NLG97_g5700 [Lecanicillium saksenae]|uniref:Uncharacterized protein n=1 Tax=Lecanicillium saksenae TaxID=468837 RepID=A0ACC1QUX6_9HYPO|nr:hypothetical protein NLG97_g5700 [Lecanicillium saksenae]